MIQTVQNNVPTEDVGAQVQLAMGDPRLVRVTVEPQDSNLWRITVLLRH